MDTSKRTRRSHDIALPELANLGFLIPKANYTNRTGAFDSLGNGIVIEINSQKVLP